MTTKVSIPSPCLSMLLQKTAKSPGQCEGFLLGEANVEESRCITDAGDSTHTDEIICEFLFVFKLEFGIIFLLFGFSPSF